ncbi:YbaB/EbfC DNA-binding family protein [Actinoallomurus bryophytorum]|uniref:YbaB/EbfC DNA-binding family protein n=1 Tax=Actinoallomurus bryophytorum TaxID=1490222 RepID=A0A543CH88_9ACTN|nr:YbaB/EbfC family nucleoid-associated protein [Actinoallomurus bryophytorum]TQL96473.1 YbaB/EbfC DNA-binding family protein [Actinoallomurus bryophytorum]
MSAPQGGMPADYGRRLEELRRLRSDVDDVTATARSRNGDVWLEVGASGELRAIRFGPQALKQLSAQRLAQTIMTLVTEAREDAAGRAKEMTAAFLPEDMAERLRDGETDLMAFLPPPPRVPEFGQD